MNLYFDIGGTYFRCYILEGNLFKEIVRVKISSDILDQLMYYIGKLFNIYSVKRSYVSIAGIVHENKIYGCNNIGLIDGTKLIENYFGVNIKYINDGDAFVLGEVYFNEIDYGPLNVLGIVFGTGVGGGLILNGKIVKNIEIHKFFESFLKENNLSEDNMDEVTDFISIDLSKIIELLNIDVLIINGYVRNYNGFSEMLESKLTCNKYYLDKLKVINSLCNNSILLGLKNI